MFYLSGNHLVKGWLFLSGTLLLLGQLVGHAIAAPSPASLTAESPPILFLPVDAAAQLSSSDITAMSTARIHVLRAQRAGVNFAALGGTEDVARAQATAISKVTLNLFHGITHMALRQRIDAYGTDGFVWQGTIENHPGSVVTFVVSNATLAGDIRIPSRKMAGATLANDIYQIRPTDNGAHLIRQIVLPVPTDVQAASSRTTALETAATAATTPAPRINPTRAAVALTLRADVSGTSTTLHVTTNWPVQEGGRHFHWFLDGVDQGGTYRLAPITVNNLSAGSHTFGAKLAEADHTFTGVAASITVTIASSDNTDTSTAAPTNTPPPTTQATVTAAPTMLPTNPPIVQPTPTALLVPKVTSGLAGRELTDLTIDGLMQFIDQEDVRDVKTLLSAMPRSMRRNYTFVEQTRTDLPSSLEHPRVILTGSDARFMMAFGSDPTDPNREKIDIAELDDESGYWIFRELNMATDPPTLTADDASCQPCHGNPVRPVWGEYATWPGIFGDTDDLLTDAQVQRLNRMAAEQIDSDRFHFLELAEPQGERLFSLPGRHYAYANTSFTMELGPAVALGIFKRMQQSPDYADLHEGFILLQCGSATRDTSAWQRFATALRNTGAQGVRRYDLVRALGIHPEHEFQIHRMAGELTAGTAGFNWRQGDGDLIDAVEFLVLDDMIRRDPTIAQRLAQLPEHASFGSGAVSLEADRQYKMRHAFMITREARQDARESAPPPGQSHIDNRRYID